MVNGWLIIDKPLSITSFSVVSLIKKIINKRKVGHAGTLDPMATGILPIAIGEATKVIEFAMNYVKEYEFVVTFGEARDTDDQEGKVIARSNKYPSVEEIRNALKFFTGEIFLSPPIFSAIKVNGKRAYNLARQGLINELPKRKSIIYKIELLEESNLNYCLETKIRVLCSKGTYVRSIARELALFLGTCGYVSYLRRTKVGNFSISQAISLENLERLHLSNELLACIMPVEVVLDDIPAFTCNPEQAMFLRQGRALSIELLEGNLNLSKEACVIKAFSGSQLTALVEKAGNYLKPIKVFNY
ncbi:tRNA pseudouridine synthase B [Rickettsiales bacterium Ac37b]|nr:tRNA pseudouridine synthase B [Rickettsiales bacterium Ac37b]